VSFLLISYNKGGKKFEPKREETTEEWRRLHTEEVYDLYCSPRIIKGIKPRIMRWLGHVAHGGEEWCV
jgi:hypothetical protein